MRIAFLLAFNEVTVCRALNFLADLDEQIFLDNPDLPGLYEANLGYQREPSEEWGDYLNILARGYEDCDGLAAARCGELRARGYRAMQPGDGGYALAKKYGLKSIDAEVVLRTQSRPEERGLYHCLVRYPIGNRVFYDDPSVRLGMNNPKRGAK